MKKRPEEKVVVKVDEAAVIVEPEVRHPEPPPAPAVENKVQDKLNHLLSIVRGK